ncbi:hypothetical protein QAD02_010696 [Eretmocerus hayati]|uniref:Uncharacterized protein n=1 Tax=Eretmocerus hayati TaxID=131215 RepID=A0ACC2NZC8_9HYME|nr:hypothetical protein QAD02_010696 [Eretmocerus hayati]
MTSAEALKKIDTTISNSQWVATFGAFLLMVQTGIIQSWGSPNLPRLQSANSTIPTTEEQASWLTSLSSIGGIPGALIGSILTGLIGSRKNMIMTIMSLAVSWLCIILADSVTWLFVARFMSGIGTGMSYACYPFFLGEVATPSARGTLITLASGGNAVGMCIGVVIETYLTMKISSLMHLSQCLLTVLLLLVLPDTPYYFVKKKNIESARGSVAFYHSKSNADEELNEIKKFIEMNDCKVDKSKFSALKTKAVCKANCYIITLSSLPALANIVAIRTYMETFLRKGNVTIINPQPFVIYSTIVGAVGVILALLLIDKVGRRFLLILSSLGLTLALVFLGSYFYLFKLGYEGLHLQWLVIFALTLYSLTFSIGFYPVPSTILGEIYPQHLKSIGGCLSGVVASTTLSITSKAYQNMVSVVGEAFVFWLHALLCTLAIPFAIFILPETKGKTFREIQMILAK